MPRARKTPTGAPAQKVEVAPGGAYGTRKATKELQAAVPINDGPVNPTPTGAPPQQRTAEEAAANMDPPAVIPLSAPSQRPDEPLTAGLPIGPGPGPSPAPPAFDPERLRRWLPALEIMAEMPDASDETRNLVRYWRSVEPLR